MRPHGAVCAVCFVFAETDAHVFAYVYRIRFGDIDLKSINKRVVGSVA